MLSENLKTLRRQKGFTQEELAARLNVVRQTVSKWEKGLSVPDAELLTRLAEVLEVPVSTLLGSAIPDDKEPDDIARQLARINEQLAVKNRRSRRIWRTAAAVLIAVVVIYLLLIAVSIIAFDKFRVDDPGTAQVPTMWRSCRKRRNSKKVLSHCEAAPFLMLIMSRGSSQG